MPLLTRPATIEKDTANEFVLSKSELISLLTSQSAPSKFLDSNNWESVRINYRANGDSQKRSARLYSSGENMVGNFYVSDKALDNFLVQEIEVHDFDNGVFPLRRNVLTAYLTELDASFNVMTNPASGFSAQAIQDFTTDHGYRVDISWTNSDADSYSIKRDGVFISEDITRGNSISDYDVQRNTSYEYEIIAYKDGVPSISNPTAIVEVGDIELDPPTDFDLQVDLVTGFMESYSATLTYQFPVDGPQQVNIYKDGVLVAPNYTETTFQDTLNAGQEDVTYEVRTSFDGLESTIGNPTGVASFPPESASNLNAVASQDYTSSHGFKVGLTWTHSPSFDSYSIYRDGVLLQSGLTSNSYNDLTVSRNTTYEYEVRTIKGSKTSDGNPTAEAVIGNLVLNAPQSLTYDVIDNGDSTFDIQLTIGFASGGPNRVNIYKDGVLLQANHTASTYTDEGIAQGAPSITYSIKTVYDGVESAGNQSATVTVPAAGGFSALAKNTNINLSNTNKTALPQTSDAANFEMAYLTNPITVSLGGKKYLEMINNVAPVMTNVTTPYNIEHFDCYMGNGQVGVYLDMALCPDDGVVVAGTNNAGTGSAATVNGYTVNKLFKLRKNGSLDTRFSDNIGSSPFNGNINGITVDSNGKIYVCGTFNTFKGVTANFFCRLNADGTLDTAYMANIGTGPAGGTTSVTKTFLAPDGKLYATGVFTTWNGTAKNKLIRLNTDGTIDTGFDAGAAQTSGNVNSIGFMSTGHLILGGAFAVWDGQSRGRIVRLTSAGAITAWSAGTEPSFGANVNAILVQSDDKVIVGGVFSTNNTLGGVSALTRNRIVRLNSNGTEDVTFYNNIGTGAMNNTVANLLALSSGKILVLGNFSSAGTTASVGGIVRLNSDGTIDPTSTANNNTGFNAGFTGGTTPFPKPFIDSSGRIIFLANATALGGHSARNGYIFAWGGQTMTKSCAIGMNFSNTEADEFEFPIADYPMKLTGDYAGAIFLRDNGFGGFTADGTGLAIGAAPANYSSRWAVNDRIGIAIDLTNQKFWFSVNGQWQNGNPETNTGGTSISTPLASKTKINLGVAFTSTTTRSLTVASSPLYTPAGFTAVS